MPESIIQFVSSLSSYVTLPIQLVYFGLVAVIGVYVFWLNARKKVGQSRQVFDVVITAVVFACILSRLLVIFTRPDLFQSARWFWLPYERIDDVVYVMQTFPWLFLKISVGGVLIDGFFFGLLVGLFGMSGIVRIGWGRFSDAAAEFVWIVFTFASIYFFIKSPDLGHLIVVGVLIILGLIHVLSVKLGLREKKIIGTVLDVVWKGAIWISPAILLAITAQARAELSGSYPVIIAIDIFAGILAVTMLLSDKLEAFVRKVIPAKPVLEESKLSETGFRHRFSISYKDMRGDPKSSLIQKGKTVRK